MSSDSSPFGDRPARSFDRRFHRAVCPPAPPEGFWSPSPVLAYRLWWIRNHVVKGARVRWTGRSLEAVCPRTGQPGVPHVDGRCGVPGCGIYAMKDIGRLRGWSHPRGERGWVAAVVALEGRVVEHEHGYRAARAGVVAAVAATRHQIAASEDPDWIEGVFAEAGFTATGAATILETAPLDPRHSRRRATDYLTAARIRQEQTWRSASHSG